MMLGSSTSVLTRTICVLTCEPGFPFVLIYADGYSHSALSDCAPVGGKMASVAIEGSLPVRVETEPNAGWVADRDFGPATSSRWACYFRSRYNQRAGLWRELTVSKAYLLWTNRRSRKVTGVLACWSRNPGRSRRMLTGWIV